MSEKFTEKYQHCKTEEEHKFTIKNSLQSPGRGGGGVNYLSRTNLLFQTAWRGAENFKYFITCLYTIELNYIIISCRVCPKLFISTNCQVSPHPALEIEWWLPFVHIFVLFIFVMGQIYTMLYPICLYNNTCNRTVTRYSIPKGSYQIIYTSFVTSPLCYASMLYETHI